MFYWYLDRLGIKEEDLDQFFQARESCPAVIVDTSHDPNGAIVGVKLLNKLALLETFRSGFLHYLDGDVHNVRFRVDAIRYSPRTCEDSFVIVGHVDPQDWKGTIPDLRSYKDIGYKQPPTMTPFDYFGWGLH